MTRKHLVNNIRARYRRRLHKNRMNCSTKKAKINVTEELEMQYNKIKSKSKVNGIKLFYNFP